MIIHVRNFGKIESADIDISNLTIFVGENNSGKTYIMQLIYGLISFLFEKEFNDFFGRFSRLPINKSITVINADDVSFYNDFQNELNNFINVNKNKIIEKTFHTHNLGIESLSIEFGKISSNFSVICNGEIKTNRGEDRKVVSICKNEKIIYGITFENYISDDVVNYIIKQEILKVILSEIVGINTGINRIENIPMLYLPASRSGIMLLYANYLANDKKQNISEDEGIIYKNDDSNESENEYGLTEPIYNFLMFLLKHKNSEMVSNSNKDIISFIDENIINGSLEKVGNTMRYKSDLSDQSIPIYLSSSLVSELSPIYQVLSGIQRYNFILYDEIETCQHPTKQLQLARLLVRMVNSGYKMIVSTHSVTMAAAINNIITLSCKENKKELANKLGYEETDLLKSTNIKAYHFIVKNGKTKVEEIPSHFTVGVGFDFDLFNNANDKIYQDAVELAKVD